MSHNTPLSEQIKIVLFGLRNSGKSSLINNIFEKDVSIISANPGTTTDPVSRTIELGELGAVTITDTAGLDDTGELGQLRIQKSLERLSVSNIALFVTRCDTPIDPIETKFIQDLEKKDKLIFIILTYGDNPLDENKSRLLNNYPSCIVDNISKKGIPEVKSKLAGLKSKIHFEISPLNGLINELDLVLLVTPIDLAAPKGRLILPQVETIRDVLDNDCASLIVKERELKFFYECLSVKPKIVITDSQVFSKVAADIPENQLLTSFSILFARKKGDLALYVEGVKNLKKIKNGSTVLILESCSHHKQADDIGTVKIPRLFRQLVNSDVNFEFAHSLPDNLSQKSYALVIQCGACMVTRNVVMQRLEKLQEHGTAVTNYGLFLAWVNGLLPRALEPFPYEYELYKKS